MGSQVIAQCKCGLDTEILIGGGMLNYTTTCYFPCLCTDCRSVVQVNLYDEPIQCPNCKSVHVIPYDDPELSDCKPDSRVIESWGVEKELGRDLVLKDGNYRCAKCGEMSLHFESTLMNWD